MKNRWWAGNWKANEWQIVGKRVTNGWHGSKRLLNEWQSVGKWLVSELETGRQINGKWSRKGSGKWLLSRKGLYTKWMANSWNTSDKWLASGSQMSPMTVNTWYQPFTNQGEQKLKALGVSGIFVDPAWTMVSKGKKQMNEMIPISSGLMSWVYTGDVMWILMIYHVIYNGVKIGCPKNWIVGSTNDLSICGPTDSCNEPWHIPPTPRGGGSHRFPVTRQSPHLTSSQRCCSHIATFRQAFLLVSMWQIVWFNPSEGHMKPWATTMG